MAGHSKWHNIRHKKAAQDAKKGKIYAKIGKLVELAAKGGADPKLNPVLDAALIKARANNLPKDVIERAVKKGSGQIEGEELVEISYEGYGVAGVAMIIKVITSNTNRSGSNIRATLTKMGGSMGEPNSVSWQFQEKGVIYVSGMVEKKQEKGKEIEIVHPLDIDKFEEDALESGAEDYDIDDGIAKITTAKEDFISTSKFLTENGYKIDEAQIEYIPDNTIELTPEQETKLERLIDALEEDDDVDEIYHNAG